MSVGRVSRNDDPVVDSNLSTLNDNKLGGLVEVACRMHMTSLLCLLRHSLRGSAYMRQECVLHTKTNLLELDF